MIDPSPSDFRFPEKFRLRLQTEFDAVYTKGLVASDAVLVIHAIRSQHEFTRIGLSVGRRVGQATVRNRWKRWIREAFRLNRNQLPTGLDIIVRPRRDARGSYRGIEQSLRKLVVELDRRLPRDQAS